jgi:hypothetical protein
VIAVIVAKFEKYRGNIKSIKCDTVSDFSLKNSEDNDLLLNAFDAFSRLNSICQDAIMVPAIMSVSKASFPISSLLSA